MICLYILQYAYWNHEKGHKEILPFAFLQLPFGPGYMKPVQFSTLKNKIFHYTQHDNGLPMYITIGSCCVIHYCRGKKHQKQFKTTVILALLNPKITSEYLHSSVSKVKHPLSRSDQSEKDIFPSCTSPACTTPK